MEIKDIKDPKLRAMCEADEKAEQALKDCVSSFTEEEKKAYMDVWLFAYLKPPFSFNDWTAMRDGIRQIVIEALIQKQTEDRASLAIACGNPHYGGELLRPYDNGLFAEQIKRSETLQEVTGTPKPEEAKE